MNLRKDHCYDRFAPRILIVLFVQREPVDLFADSLVTRKHTHTHTKHNAKAIFLWDMSPDSSEKKKR